MKRRSACSLWGPCAPMPSQVLEDGHSAVATCSGSLGPKLCAFSEAKPPRFTGRGQLPLLLPPGTTHCWAFLCPQDPARLGSDLLPAPAWYAAPALSTPSSTRRLPSQETLPSASAGPRPCPAWHPHLAGLSCSSGVPPGVEVAGLCFAQAGSPASQQSHERVSPQHGPAFPCKDDKPLRDRPRD